MGAEPGSGIRVYGQPHTRQVMSQDQGPSQESCEQQKLMGPETGLETGYSGSPKSLHVRGLGTSAPSIAGAQTDGPRLR